jgi:hypothetical protein
LRERPRPRLGVFRFLLGVAIALQLAAATAASPAKAQAPVDPILLDAQLPDRLQRCVSAERLQTSYERARAEHAQERGAEPQSEPLRVELRVSGDERSDPVQLELRAFHGARSFGVRVLPVRVRDCGALADTLALVLELLSRSAPAQPTAPPEAAPPPQPTAASDTELPPIMKLPRPRSGTEPTWGAGLGIGAFFGALPDAAPTLQLLAAFRIPLLQLRLRATIVWPQRSTILEGSVQMNAYELAVEGCPTWELEPWALRLCVGPHFGIVHAASRGFIVRNRNATELSLYFGVLPELALALTATTWLQLSGGIAVALQRPKFALELQDVATPLALDGPNVLRTEIGLTVLQIF